MLGAPQGWGVHVHLQGQLVQEPEHFSVVSLKQAEFTGLRIL